MSCHDRVWSIISADGRSVISKNTPGSPTGELKHPQTALLLGDFLDRADKMILLCQNRPDQSCVISARYERTFEENANRLELLVSTSFGSINFISVLKTDFRIVISPFFININDVFVRCHLHFLSTSCCRCPWISEEVCLSPTSQCPHLCVFTYHFTLRQINYSVQGPGTMLPINHHGGQLMRILQGPRAGETCTFFTVPIIKRVQTSLAVFYIVFVQSSVPQ